MEQQTVSFRFSLKQLLVLVVLIAIVCAIPSWIGKLAISQRTLDDLYSREESLTRDEILKIAGAPHSCRGDEEYCYNVWNGFVFFSDMFCIKFDSDGHVVSMSF